MKKFLVLFAALLFVVAACDKQESIPADGSSALDFRASVEPRLVDPWQSGNAAFECTQAGGCGDFAYKIDEWGNSGMNGNYSDPNGEQGTAAANVITIYNSDGYTFSWTSEYEVCQVIVKGSTGAYVYYYPEGSCGDEGLTAPLNANSAPIDDTYEISHVSFCWNDTPCDEDPNGCYQDETAWAANGNTAGSLRYNTRRGANWATYTAYTGVAKTVTLFAGQTMNAGTVSFSAPVSGQVTITINLAPGFIFYYDMTSQYEDDNVKVQDYLSAPSGNPSPGLFAWKAVAPVASTTYSIVVPQNNFYGVHVDVARQVECGE